jgi:hypothetical protein
VRAWQPPLALPPYGNRSLEDLRSGLRVLFLSIA